MIECKKSGKPIRRNFPVSGGPPPWENPQALNQKGPGSEAAGAFISLVGETGFEPATPAPPAQCSTRLSYSPMFYYRFDQGQWGVRRARL